MKTTPTRRGPGPGALDDLAAAATRDRLKWGVLEPRAARPGETRQSLVAQALRERGHDPQAVAHFVNRLVFCMFADERRPAVGHMFTRMRRHARPAPEPFPQLAGAAAGLTSRARQLLPTVMLVRKTEDPRRVAH